MKGKQLKAYQQNFSKRRMFIGNIPPGLTDHELKIKFSEFGEVETAYMIRDHITGESSSFGYILFKDPRVRKRVLNMDVQIMG